MAGDPQGGEFGQAGTRNQRMVDPVRSPSVTIVEARTSRFDRNHRSAAEFFGRLKTTGLGNQRPDLWVSAIELLDTLRSKRPYFGVCLAREWPLRPESGLARRQRCSV